MENHASNPAGRLWLYFTSFRDRPGNQAVNKGAREYFGAPAGYTEQYLTAVAALMRLPDEVEAMVNQLDTSPIPVAKLLRPLGPVREVLRTDPLGSQQVSWVSSQIDSGVLSDLETTSHVLSSYVAQMSDIADDTLASIRELAEEIIALARDDESLSSDARASIIRYASSVVTATDLYKVTGPQALVDELDRFYSNQRRVVSNPSPTLKQKLGQLVGTIVIAVELFGAPANFDNAIEYYGEVFELTETVEAPGSSDEVIVIAESAENDDLEETG